MAYVDPFDVATPADTDMAEQGDNRLRELKRALDERLKTAFSGWPDQQPLQYDGKVLVRSGTFAARPITPLDGELFYVTDRNELHVGEGGSWINITSLVKTGLDSARSGVSHSDGLLFYATDKAVLYISAGGQWVAIAGGTTGGGTTPPASNTLPVYYRGYDADTPGTIDLGTVTKIFVVNVSGTTGTAGELYIRQPYANEIPLQNVVVIGAHFWQVNNGAGRALVGVDYDPVAGPIGPRLKLTLADYATETLLNAQYVSGYITLGVV